MQRGRTKKKLVIFGILLFIFLLIVVIQYFVLKNVNPQGRLKVLSSPTASLFLDNLAIGKTPFEDSVKAGEYTLKLIPEGSATEAASWEIKIKITSNALTYVNAELGKQEANIAGDVLTIEKMKNKPEKGDTGEIYVETEPAGGIVYLDNDEKGVAPLTLTNVLQGEHELAIFLPGFFRRSIKINVVPKYRINAYIKLAVDISQQKEEEIATPSAETKSSTPSAKLKKWVVIQDTPTGWLRVRSGPSLSASESAKVKPGEKYEFLDEKSGWYKIKYDEDKEGWVSSRYAKIEEE